MRTSLDAARRSSTWARSKGRATGAPEQVAEQQQSRPRHEPSRPPNPRGASALPATGAGAAVCARVPLPGQSAITVELGCPRPRGTLPRVTVGPCPAGAAVCARVLLPGGSAVTVELGRPRPGSTLPRVTVGPCSVTPRCARLAPGVVLPGRKVCPSPLHYARAGSPGTTFRIPLANASDIATTRG